MIYFIIIHYYFIIICYNFVLIMLWINYIILKDHAQMHGWLVLRS